jgi:hypothetical protein
MYRVPIKIFDHLHIQNLDSAQEQLYPMDTLTDEQLRDRYSAAIYARLEEEGTLDPGDPMYQGLLQMFNSTRDGYSLLKALLAATLVVDSKNIGIINTPPQATQGTNPYEYAVQLRSSTD